MRMPKTHWKRRSGCRDRWELEGWSTQHSIEKVEMRTLRSSCVSSTGSTESADAGVSAGVLPCSAILGSLLSVFCSSRTCTHIHRHSFTQAGICRLFLERANSKYFRLCWPHAVSVTYSSPPTPQPFRNVKIILHLRAKHIWALGHIWPMGWFVDPCEAVSGNDPIKATNTCLGEY